MQKRTIYLIFFLILFSCTEKINSQSYNLNVENIDSDKKPLQWSLGFNKNMLTSYPVIVDSVVKHSGNYSLRLYFASKGSDFGSCSIVIPSVFTGKTIVLKGFLKTENVKGSAGLWLRLDGADGNTLGFDNMGNRPVSGTNDWKEFTINLPFSENVEKINVGALLAGEGTVWVDDLSVQIDGHELPNVPAKIIKHYAAALDTAFIHGSGINFELTAVRQEALATLGLVWGFLKYHHPSIAKGDYNWDAELMRIVPAIIAASNKTEWMKSLEQWVDKLPAVPKCSNCKPIVKNGSVVLMPDYGGLFNEGYLSPTLLSKLKFIQDNANNSFNYYVGLEPGVENPKFTNENNYDKMNYPDAGYRLLTLYRYWNQVQYFFPYRHLIKEDWDKILPAFILEFINAKDSSEYVLACLKLIAKIHDSHANIWNNNKALNNYWGTFYPPFSTRFIEDKLVLRNYLVATPDIRQLITKNDIITHVDGVAVKDFAEKNLDLMPASNYAVQLRSIPNFILRGKTNKITITILRDNKSVNITIPRYEAKALNFAIDYDPSPADSSYKIINKDIGYIYPGKYKNSQLPAIIKAFKNTKGIIVDMRCYPSEFMPFTFGNYIKPYNSTFVIFTRGDIKHPGLFVFSNPISNGGKYDGGVFDAHYNGKIIIIVNEQTQSQAEYTTMAFQSAPNVKVIGSTTAGADGNVSPFYLPGGISTMISGIGVYYPDKTETQRVGVKIDLLMKPTLKGYQEGRDELLEKAIEMLQ